MSQGTRIRFLWPVVLLLASLLSSWRPGRPEEPAGQPVALQPNEVAVDLPLSLGLWAGWHRKGDRFVAEGDLRKALFCYHQAEDAFPSERPAFPEGSDWNEREWSGKPVRTYLAKALLYGLMGESEAGQYYLALGQSYRESPSDDPEIARARAYAAFQRKLYPEVRDLLATSADPNDRLLSLISAYLAGDKTARERALELHQQILSRPGDAYRYSWLPASARRTVEGR